MPVKNTKQLSDEEFWNYPASLGEKIVAFSYSPNTFVRNTNGCGPNFGRCISKMGKKNYTTFTCSAPRWHCIFSVQLLSRLLASLRVNFAYQLCQLTQPCAWWSEPMLWVLSNYIPCALYSRSRKIVSSDYISTNKTGCFFLFCIQSIGCSKRQNMMSREIVCVAPSQGMN
mgnify:CR=1 FL=1